MSRTQVKMPIGAVRQSRDFAKSPLSGRIVAFLEDESRNAEQTGGMTKIVELFLYGIAHEYQRTHLLPLVLTPHVRQDLADLGMTGSAFVRPSETQLLRRRERPSSGLGDRGRGLAIGRDVAGGILDRGRALGERDRGAALQQPDQPGLVIAG